MTMTKIVLVAFTIKFWREYHRKRLLPISGSRNKKASKLLISHLLNGVVSLFIMKVNFGNKFPLQKY